MHGLSASMCFLKDIGLDNIARHNAYLRDYFLEHYPKKKYSLITPRDGLGNIICLKAVGGTDSRALEEKLRRENIDISVRQGNARISFHIFNTEGQVELLIKALDI